MHEVLPAALADDAQQPYLAGPVAIVVTIDHQLPLFVDGIDNAVAPGEHVPHVLPTAIPDAHRLAKGSGRIPFRKREVPGGIDGVDARERLLAGLGRCGVRAAFRRRVSSRELPHPNVRLCGPEHRVHGVLGDAHAAHVGQEVGK